MDTPGPRGHPCPEIPTPSFPSCFLSSADAAVVLLRPSLVGPSTRALPSLRESHSLLPRGVERLTSSIIPPAAYQALGAIGLFGGLPSTSSPPMHESLTSCNNEARKENFWKITAYGECGPPRSTALAYDARRCRWRWRWRYKSVLPRRCSTTTSS